jgi:predicted GNAT family N-acyltransferase
MTRSARVPGGIRIEPASSEVVLPLRASLLRPGLPVDLARYEQDSQPGTVHLAAFAGDGEVVGISTWSPDTWLDRPAWRLRGMATAESVRGRGVGAGLVAAGLELGVARGAEFAWCNARTGALGFYRRFGFEAVGEEFEVQYAGPHFRMWRRLPADAAPRLPRS